MEASLRPVGNVWVRTTSYDRLDQSEKSAVSFFLGMAQAQLSCHQLLNVSSLVHIDTYLRAIGKPSKKSRPDLLGYDWLTGTAVVVEAKGRTHGYSDKLVNDAKAQAMKLPALAGHSSTSIASIGWSIEPVPVDRRVLGASGTCPDTTNAPPVEP
jgi:hypothetical protein